MTEELDPGAISFDKAHLTDDELAALVSVLVAASRAEKLRSADDRPRAGGWNSYYRTLRPPLVTGRDAWRTYHRM